jgi:hypothetical protein
MLSNFIFIHFKCAIAGTAVVFCENGALPFFRMVAESRF